VLWNVCYWKSIYIMPFNAVFILRQCKFLGRGSFNTGKGGSLHAMKAYRGWGIASRALNVRTRWRCQLYASVTLPPEKECPLNRWMDEPERRFCLTSSGNKPRFLGRPAHSLVMTPTTQSWLHPISGDNFISVYIRDAMLSVPLLKCRAQSISENTSDTTACTVMSQK
jgi:hypothetical protein